MTKKESSIGLNDRQKSFCREYAFDYNGTRAYQAAYPDSSYESAMSSACDLLSNPKIKTHLQYLKDNLEELSGISRLMVLREHQKLAFSSIAHLHNTWVTRKEFESLTDEQKACIAEISTQTRVEKVKGETPVKIDFVKIKLYDKQKALDSISKMMGYDAATKTDITSGGEKMELRIGSVQVIKPNDKKIDLSDAD